MVLPRALVFLMVLLVSGLARADEKPLPQDWEYAAAMKKLAAGSHGRPGVVLHIGDSITYANPYSQWTRAGEGQTPEDKAALKWMHAGADDDTDGWYLCRFDLPGGRSYTACGGIRISEMLEGGKSGMPPLKDLLDRYKPQAVVMMLGTNDVSAGRTVEAFQKDMEQAVRLMLDRNIVCILSTIPPHPGNEALSQKCNEALRQIARKNELPLIDFEREILLRRPKDWNGTLLGKNDVHPTATQGGTTSNSAPTAENLRNSGYLLRGWLSVKKIEEVKTKVFDAKGDASLPAPEVARAVPSSSPAPATPPGEAVRAAVTRDTWFSNVGDESKCNMGGASQLKLKSIQEMSLIDIDPAPFKERIVTGALLHLRRRGEEALHRVTVSSFASDWVEGTAQTYTPQPGSSCFNFKKYADALWAGPGSDLTAVTLGQGGTVWASAEASAPDPQGWMQISVDPRVVQARIAGVSQGFLLFDDTGSEWTRNGETFISRHMPNRFVFSRDSGEKDAPYFTIYLGGTAAKPPAAPTELQSVSTGLNAGEVAVSWISPPDGDAPVAGFVASVNGAAIPQYLLPRAKPGARVSLHVPDIGTKPGDSEDIVVRAVDGAGNTGPEAKISAAVSAGQQHGVPGVAPMPFSEEAPLPAVGTAGIAVVDALDKVQPVTGQMIPPQEGAYLSANHLWSAKQKRIRLHAGKNEFVLFQVLVRGAVQDLKASLDFGNEAPSPKVMFYSMRDVASKIGPVPDPLLPLADSYSTPKGDTWGSIVCEIYVPHEAAAGKKAGVLTLSSGANELKLAVDLGVWDFTLPDVLSFLPEMNCYGLPENERDYYRLAHRNRTVINRVPYHQNGSIAQGVAPGWDGKSMNWATWDKRFGPLLDGSAFSDLPRRGIPLDVFYLPLHENWPTPMEGNYNGSYWADAAFPPAYRTAFVEASRQFAEHANQQKWHDTIFQCFFNGKNNFKEHGWSHGSSPWLLDEPMHFQDFWALHWFGKAFHDGIASVPGSAKLMFRCDISRPQWQRDLLDDVLDYNVVAGGAFRQYRPLVLDRKQRLGQVVISYGTTNDPASSNVQSAGWCLDTWTLGADGVLPWQVIGDDSSWKQAQDTCLFYPGETVGREEPIPSIRLKGYLRGEQDVEYLVMLARLEKLSQLQLGERVRAVLKLAGSRQSTGFTGGEDAGVIDFGNLRPQDLWSLRERIAAVLSEAHPAPERKLLTDRKPRAPAKAVD